MKRAGVEFCGSRLSLPSLRRSYQTWLLCRLHNDNVQCKKTKYQQFYQFYKSLIDVNIKHLLCLNIILNLFAL